jgi:hypothetical protein
VYYSYFYWIFGVFIYLQIIFWFYYPFYQIWNDQISPKGPPARCRFWLDQTDQDGRSTDRSLPPDALGQTLIPLVLSRHGNRLHRRRHAPANSGHFSHRRGSQTTRRSTPRRPIRIDLVFLTASSRVSRYRNPRVSVGDFPTLPWLRRDYWASWRPPGALALLLRDGLAGVTSAPSLVCWSGYSRMSTASPCPSCCYQAQVFPPPPFLSVSVLFVALAWLSSIGGSVKLAPLVQ